MDRLVLALRVIAHIVGQCIYAGVVGLAGLVLLAGIIAAGAALISGAASIGRKP